MIDNHTREKIEETQRLHKFLTFLVDANGDLRIGVVQNVTPKLVMFYDMAEIKTADGRAVFLQLADEWW